MAAQYIIIACWAVLILYWSVSARFLSPVQEVKKDFGGGWTLAGRIFFGFLFFASFIDFRIFSFAIIPDSAALQAISIAMVIAGTFVAVYARSRIAGYWSANIDLKVGHKLITSGIYSHIRHPIYSGILLMALGTFLFTGRISALIFFLVMLSFILYKIKEEEELLSRHFPEYPEYRRHTKALIPFLW